MLFIIWLCLLKVIAAEETTIIQTEYGPLKGYKRDGDHGKEYFSFRGVPYAKQPVGNLRFEYLQPPEVWKEVYDARTESPICIQRRKFFSKKYLQKQRMSEECLGANIHVPAERGNKELLPVLVFIHGSGFNYLSSDTDVYGPEYLIAKGIVVVTFNYRINLFGFLALNTKEAPGNLSLKDILFFLNWVQRNIAAFGGDPDNVTLGGLSSGAASVHLLTLSEKAVGLFKRVIMHSGTAISPLMAGLYPGYNELLISNLVTRLGYNTTDPHQIFTRLKYEKIEILQEVLNKMLDESGILMFTPTIEKYMPEVDNFLTKLPWDVMRSKRYVDVPQLIGFTSDESLTFENRLKYINIIDRIKLNPTLIVPTDLVLTSTPKKLAELIELFKNTYFDNGQIDYSDMPYFEKYLDDAFIIYPALRLANFSATHHKEPTYLFEFKFKGRHNLYSNVVSGAAKKGAGHIDDIAYLFRPNFYEKNDTMMPGSLEELTKNRIVEMWSNFIITGNPTPTISELVPVQWPPTDSKQLTYLSIDNDLTVESDPLPRVREFYNQFYLNNNA